MLFEGRVAVPRLWSHATPALPAETGPRRAPITPVMLNGSPVCSHVQPTTRERMTRRYKPDWPPQGLGVALRERQGCRTANADPNRVCCGDVAYLFVGHLWDFTKRVAPIGEPTG